MVIPTGRHSSEETEGKNKNAGTALRGNKSWSLCAAAPLCYVCKHRAAPFRHACQRSLPSAKILIRSFAPNRAWRGKGAARARGGLVRRKCRCGALRSLGQQQQVACCVAPSIDGMTTLKRARSRTHLVNLERRGEEARAWRGGEAGHWRRHSRSLSRGTRSLVRPALYLLEDNARRGTLEFRERMRPGLCHIGAVCLLVPSFVCRVSTVMAPGRVS